MKLKQASSILEFEEKKTSEAINLKAFAWLDGWLPFSIQFRVNKTMQAML